MKIQTQAQVLYANFLAYTLGNAKSIFGGNIDINEHRKRKKEQPGTRRVICWSSAGQYRSLHTGPRGKAASQGSPEGTTHPRLLP